MNISKNNKKYTINECKDYWSIKYLSNGFSVNYNVDKELCKTEEDLHKYILSNEMF